MLAIISPLTTLSCIIHLLLSVYRIIIYSPTKLSTLLITVVTTVHHVAIYNNVYKYPATYSYNGFYCMYTGLLDKHYYNYSKQNSQWSFALQGDFMLIYVGENKVYFRQNLNEVKWGEINCRETLRKYKPLFQANLLVRMLAFVQHINRNSCNNGFLQHQQFNLLEKHIECADQCV